MALSPEEQTLFQQLQAKAQGDAPPQQPQQMPAPGSFKDDPEGAIAHIMARATGPQLQQRQGGLVDRVPVNSPLRLFGVKKDRPVGPDYFSSIQQAGLSEFIPEGVPRTPEGKPYISEKTSDQIKQLAATRRASLAEAPNKEWGEALKSKALEEFGPKHPRYRTLVAAIDAAGGAPLSKIKEISDTFVRQDKQGDIYKGSDGIMYYRDRSTEESKPLPGGISGILSTFNPLELSFVKSEMKGFDSDAVVKDARKQIAQLTSVSALVEGRNPASLGILASNIAKGLGREAGVLTEGDIARATGSQQLGDKWKRYWAKHIKGQLSDTDVSDFHQLMYEINTAAQKQVKNVAVNRAQRLGKVLKRDPKELVDIVSFGTEFMPADEAQPLQSTSPFTADRPGAAPTGFTPEKAKRLAALREKQKAGTLGKK